MKKSYFFQFTTITTLFLSIIIFASCGNDDEPETSKIETNPIIMYAGSERTIEGAETIESENEFVAYGKENVLKAYHVGETTITVNGKHTISVTILPVHRLYDDPICNWGCNKTYIIQNQKQGQISSKSGVNELGYENAGGATVLEYQFENGKLNKVIAVVSTKHTSLLVDYLTERYIMVPKYSGEKTYYVGMDGLSLATSKTAIIMQIATVDYIGIIYSPSSEYASSRQASFSQEYEELVNENSDK